MIRLQTTAPSRTIKQTLQALVKAKAIGSAHKFQYAKQYLPDERGRLQTHNVQMVVLHPDVNWDRSGEQILNNVLKSYEIINH